MSNIVSSEKAMAVQRVMKLSECDSQLMMNARLRDPPESDDILVPLAQVYAVATTLLTMLLTGKNPSLDLARRARNELDILF